MHDMMEMDSRLHDVSARSTKSAAYVDSLVDRFRALQEAACLVAVLAGETEQLDNSFKLESDIATCLSTSGNMAVRRFDAKCEEISDFMRAGLRALQTARAHRHLNVDAARQLVREYDRVCAAAIAMLKKR